MTAERPASLPADGSTPAASENRQERRMRVLKAGRIIYNAGYSVADCRVRNLSATGAMLEVANVVGLPTRFEIAIDGVRRPCKVVWRTERLLGVAFDAADPARDVA